MAQVIRQDVKIKMVLISNLEKVECQNLNGLISNLDSHHPGIAVVQPQGGVALPMRAERIV